VLTALQTKVSPTHLGMLFWPEFGAALATALIFGLLFRTRFVALLAFGGMIMLSAATAVLTGATSGSDAVVAVGAGLLGIGVGASVSPALFQAGFSLKSAQLPRVFALIELLRGVAAFMVGPILLHVAQTVSKDPASGTRTAMWICFAIAAGGALIAAGLFLLGRARLQAADLEPWLEGESPAIESPPLLAAVRGQPRAVAGH